MFILNTGLNILKSNIQQTEVYGEAMYSVFHYNERLIQLIRLLLKNHCLFLPTAASS